jgi:hypothetical protein
VEGLLRERPELGVFGVKWVRAWIHVGERLVEVARVSRRLPRAVGVIKSKPVDCIHPYTLGVLRGRERIRGNPLVCALMLVRAVLPGLSGGVNAD